MTKWRVQDVMTTDVITAPADARIADLVTLLTERQISAVPIVDDFGTVLGVVSWADLHPLIEISLFTVHDRLDPVIRDDVRHQVLLDELGLRPGAVHVTVNDGVVTLTGRAEHRTAALAARMAEQIPGVTEVDNQIQQANDTAPAASSLRRHYLVLDDHLRSMTAA